MGNTYSIITDASCDILPSWAEEENIHVIPMEVTFDDGGVFSITYDNATISLSDFYRRLQGQTCTTSGISPQDYMAFMRPLLEGGNDILYSGLTAALSSSYDNACLAAQQLREEYPERRIFVIDSFGATAGLGYHLYLCALNRKNGMSLEDNAKWLEETRFKLNYTWTVSDLMHLRRGGRLSNVSAVVGTALQIKPIGVIENDGQLVSIGKTRGRKASLNKICQMMGRLIDTNLAHEVVISHCDCEGDAEQLRDMVLATGKVDKVTIARTGPVVGAHLGPTGLCCFYFSSRRGTASDL